MTGEASEICGWQHVDHDADIGLVGTGRTVAEAFEQVALGMTAIVTDAPIRCELRVSVTCEAPDLELLLADWLNALIFEMATREVLFGAYSVVIEDHRLVAEAWGEPVERARHQPAVEVKGATLTGVDVHQDPEGVWHARAWWTSKGSRERIRGIGTMDINRFDKVSDNEWRVAPHGAMRVPAVLFADEGLIHDMDGKVYEQMTNVATLPGIVGASYAMPDAHWGYGFPIGGVAAFDATHGVVSAGGVGFDISCGVRSLITGIPGREIEARARPLADALFAAIPAGVGSRGALRLDDTAMHAMLEGGASWAVGQGYGEPEDLARVEESGRMAGARAECVSEKAKRRQQREMGTLGSGNHYLEIQRVREIFDSAAASAYGLRVGEIMVTIHCGSRGLGHQIGTEFLREMAVAAPQAGIHLPDRELACAPIRSELGQRYLGAMRAAINCALANRQIICHLTREVFHDFFPEHHLDMLFDVSHNTCKEERHQVDGEEQVLFVHRKGATRAFGPGHAGLPASLADVGQPVLIGGSMGTSSYVLAGSTESETHAWSSACHGAGRAMSRRAASRRWNGRALVDELARRGILVRSPSLRGVAEEAPLAYKDVGAVVDCAHRAGLARKVAEVTPMVCIKG